MTLTVVIPRGQHLFFRTAESWERQGTFSCKSDLGPYAG